MKTTVEIGDTLCEEAKRVAAREGATLRELIESGLRHELRRRQSNRDFKLRNESFAGKGLQPDFRDADWSRIRAAAYQDRGG